MQTQKWFTLRALLTLLVAHAFVVNANPANANPGVTADSADLLLFPDVADNVRLGPFFLGIINNGPDIARNVVLRFPVPEGTVLDQIQCSVQSTCTLPPSSRTGEIVCAIGDLLPSGRVHITIVLNIHAVPGTRISIEARVSSDTPDVNLADNVFSSDFVVPGFPRIDSVRVLKNPFRIELRGENLSVPQFVNSGIGIGCDCSPWPFNLARTVAPGVVIIEGGTDLKNLFPKGTPVHICYFDLIRGITLKTTFTR